WMMITANAAGVTATDAALGTLAKGKLADVTVFDASVHKDYRAVIDADPQDVALVMRAGKVLYGDQTVVSAVPNTGACDALDVRGPMKQVCLTGGIGKTYATLSATNSSLYAAFFCGGPPSGEPSCVPSRPAAVMGSTVYTGAITAADSDGD